jgi:hypothetical protein
LAASLHGSAASNPTRSAQRKKLEKFLTDLAIRQDVWESTQNQALNAVLFFYKHVLEKQLGNVDALRATRPSMKGTRPRSTKRNRLKAEQIMELEHLSSPDPTY